MYEIMNYSVLGGFNKQHFNTVRKDLKAIW